MNWVERAERAYLDKAKTTPAIPPFREMMATIPPMSKEKTMTDKWPVSLSAFSTYCSITARKLWNR